MGQFDIIRAWKDEEYRASLTDEQREALPDAPKNIDALSDEELKAAAGAVGPAAVAAGATVVMAGAAVSDAVENWVDDE